MLRVGMAWLFIGAAELLLIIACFWGGAAQEQTAWGKQCHLPFVIPGALARVPMSVTANVEVADLPPGSQT
jgi:hypothetical protein